jgi:hypothetical protein
LPFWLAWLGPSVAQEDAPRRSPALLAPFRHFSLSLASKLLSPPSFLGHITEHLSLIVLVLSEIFSNEPEILYLLKSLNVQPFSTQMDQWERLKPQIEQLWMKDRRSVKDVEAIMRRDHGFDAV